MTCQIVYHNGNCLNTKKPFAQTCKLCIEHCPHQAISEYRQLNAKLCTECGVCMAVCPSDGFVDQTMDKLHDFLFEAKEVVLNCPQAVQCGYEIPCLGIFDRDGWLTLMLLAQEKSVTIMTGVCAACADRQACAASVRVFKQIHEDWPEHAKVGIQVHSAEEFAGAEVEKGGKPASCPEGKLGWKERGLKKLEEWLPALTADETYLLPKTRQGFLRALEIYPEVKIPYPALNVADSCTNCGVCTAICPQGALQKHEEMSPIIEDDNKEDKIASMRLIWEPQKCVQCCRCLKICKAQALSYRTKLLSQRLLTGKILLHEGSPKYCAQCGRRIFNNSDLCLVCSTNNLEGRSSFFL